jgi:hypothetical protein
VVSGQWPVVAVRRRGHARSVLLTPDSPISGAKELAGSTTKNFLDALLAVVAGNAIYFLLMPHLPPAMRHSFFREDLGLLVDFFICAAIFAVVKSVRRHERSPR